MSNSRAKGLIAANKWKIFEKLKHTLRVYLQIFRPILISYLFTYFVTYLFTPRSRVLEKQTGSQPVKKFLAFYGSRRFNIAFDIQRTVHRDVLVYIFSYNESQRDALFLTFIG